MSRSPSLHESVKQIGFKKKDGNYLTQPTPQHCKVVILVARGWGRGMRSCSLMREFQFCKMEKFRRWLLSTVSVLYPADCTLGND